METSTQKKKQVIVAVATSFLLLAVAFAPTMTLAIDNNNSNEDYHSFAYSHNVTKTRAREKRDASKSWNYCTQVTNGATHTVEVAANKNNETYFVGSPVYTWTPGQSGYLTNNVYEYGYRWAQLWFNNITGNNITISGQWSLDNYRGIGL